MDERGIGVEISKGWNRRTVLAGAAAGLLGPVPAAAAAYSFNRYILKAIDKIAAERAKGGYDLSCAFTRDLTYGDDVVHASPSGKNPSTKTMCVAGVAEVMIEAINLYAAETHDESPYEKLPASTWTSGRVNALRPYMFLQPDIRNIYGYKRGDTPQSKNKTTGETYFSLARGTGHALSIFHVGEEVAFSALKPGDFVNLNRSTGSGHATVFISYIDRNNTHSTTYSNDVLGFQYFSAQGKGKPDAGFAYRDAYFVGNAPPQTAGRPRDSNVLKPTTRLWLDCGRMWMPSAWDTARALKEIRDRVNARIPAGPTRGADTDAALKEQAPETLFQFTDDDEG